MHYIIAYIHHATSHQYSARCDPKDLGPMALTTIDTHANSYNYTTKVALALNTIVSHTISCIQAYLTGQVQNSLYSS